MEEINAGGVMSQILLGTIIKIFSKNYTCNEFISMLEKEINLAGISYATSPEDLKQNLFLVVNKLPIEKHIKNAIDNLIKENILSADSKTLNFCQRPNICLKHLNGIRIVKCHLVLTSKLMTHTGQTLIQTIKEAYEKLEKEIKPVETKKAKRKKAPTEKKKKPKTSASLAPPTLGAQVDEWIMSDPKPICHTPRVGENPSGFWPSAPAEKKRWLSDSNVSTVFNTLFEHLKPNYPTAEAFLSVLKDGGIPLKDVPCTKDFIQIFDEDYSGTEKSTFDFSQLRFSHVYFHKTKTEEKRFYVSIEKTTDGARLLPIGNYPFYNAITTLIYERYGELVPPLPATPDTKSGSRTFSKPASQIIFASILALCKENHPSVDSFFEKLKHGITLSYPLPFCGIDTVQHIFPELKETNLERVLRTLNYDSHTDQLTFEPNICLQTSSEWPRLKLEITTDNETMFLAFTNVTQCHKGKENQEELEKRVRSFPELLKPIYERLKTIPTESAPKRPRVVHPTPAPEIPAATTERIQPLGTHRNILLPPPLTPSLSFGKLPSLFDGILDAQDPSDLHLSPRPGKRERE